MSPHNHPTSSGSQQRTSVTQNTSRASSDQQGHLLKNLQSLQLSANSPGVPSTYISPYAPISQQSAQSSSGSSSSKRPKTTSRSSANSRDTAELTQSPATSTQSSSSLYSTKGASPQSSTSGKMSSAKKLSQSDKATLVQSLRTHRVNTLIELRRIEKIFATLNSPDVTEPMTSAWAHYVNSNNLLSELRGLTKSYPFSSECLDEAKWMVIADPQSTRSWNYCWLVLQKMKNQNLIPKHARQQAVKPVMWGGRTPTAAGVEQLTTAFMAEWTHALNQLLRHWDSPPTTTGK